MSKNSANLFTFETESIQNYETQAQDVKRALNAPCNKREKWRRIIFCFFVSFCNFLIALTFALSKCKFLLWTWTFCSLSASCSIAWQQHFWFFVRWHWCQEPKSSFTCQLQQNGIAMQLKFCKCTRCRRHTTITITAAKCNAIQNFQTH